MKLKPYFVRSCLKEGDPLKQFEKDPFAKFPARPVTHLKLTKLKKYVTITQRNERFYRGRKGETKYPQTCIGMSIGD